MPVMLTFAFDTWTEQTAIYVDGRLRAEAERPSDFDAVMIIECYQQFAGGAPVVLERVEFESRNKDFLFPETLASLDLYKTV